MKCVCGYEAEKEKFIYVVNLASEKDFPDDTTFFKLHFPNDDIHYSRIFACPECGTLQIEVKCFI
jgi:hypothetical protein